MEYKSSLHEVDYFLGSHVYDDMRTDFDHWLEGAREKIESLRDFDEICRQQGRIDVLRDVISWAEDFRNIIEENMS